LLAGQQPRRHREPPCSHRRPSTNSTGSATTLPFSGYGEALDLLNEALEIGEATGERWFEADLHRLKAEALLAHPFDDKSVAEASLRRALVVAQELETRFWELRAATQLARLWRQEGRLDEARDLLAPLYGWFSEGFDTTALRNAKALLDELTCGARPQWSGSASSKAPLTGPAGSLHRATQYAPADASAAVVLTRPRS
jgi:hypothetical protein